MRPAEPLTIQTARTGNSLTLTMLGGIALAKLGALAAIRELLWKSEKTKWEAKSAKWDYEERLRMGLKPFPPQEQSAESRAAMHITTLITLVDRSEHITSLNVEIDGEDTDPDNPGPLIKPVGPKSPLSYLITPSRLRKNSI